MIKQRCKSNDVEIVQVLHQNDNRVGGADYIGFDNGNREYSWREQYGNEAILGYRDSRNRLLHLGCETKDKASIGN